MKLGWVVIPAVCALGALGCSVAVEPIDVPVVVPATTGTLTMRWLVAGTRDGAVCAHYGLEEVDVVVYDPSGRPFARDTAPCARFEMTMELPEGVFSADVDIRDRRGRRATTTKTLHALEIIRDTDLAVNLDFPLDSIRSD